jgi:hypothetical protein
MDEEDSGTHIGVELADERREVAVLEVLGEEVACELGGAPHHERRAGVVPGDRLVRGRVLHHGVRLRQERRSPRRRRRHQARECGVERRGKCEERTERGRRI